MVLCGADESLRVLLMEKDSVATNIAVETSSTNANMCRSSILPVPPGERVIKFVWPFCTRDLWWWLRATLHDTAIWSFYHNYDTPTLYNDIY